MLVNTILVCNTTVPWRMPFVGTAVVYPKLYHNFENLLYVSMSPFGSQTTRRETKDDCDWKQGLAVSGPPAAPNGYQAQKGRQQEIMMGGNKDWRFLARPRRHHPVLKLQEGRQEDIMMRDNDWRFPGTPGSTIHFSSYKQRDNTRDNDGRQGLAVCRGLPAAPPRLQAGRQQDPRNTILRSSYKATRSETTGD